MPDYKQLYLDLFRANERAIRILIEAQQQAEAMLLDSEAPPLYIIGRDAASSTPPAPKKSKPQASH